MLKAWFKGCLVETPALRDCLVEILALRDYLAWIKITLIAVLQPVCDRFCVLFCDCE